MPVSLLYLNPSANIGGAERSLLDLIANLDRQQFEPIVVLFKPGLLAEQLHQLNIPVTIIPVPENLLAIGRHTTFAQFPHLIGTSFSLLKFYLAVFNLIRTKNIRIVHSNGLKTHFLAIPLRIFSRVKLIWHFRETVSPRWFYPWLWRLIKWRVPHGVITNSAWVRDDILHLGPIPANRIQVVYNGIDTARFFPVENCAERDYIQLGIFAPLTPIKGFSQLFRVLATIKRGPHQFRLWVVGQSFYDTAGHRDYETILKREVAALSLTNEVEFLGFRDDVPKLMRQCDIIVQPSLQPEGFGRSVAEALACGIPVITSNRGGTVEIVAHNKTGLLIDPDDPTAFEAALLCLMNDPLRRHGMGQAGSNRVRNCFSIEKYRDAIEDIYHSLIP